MKPTTPTKVELRQRVEQLEAALRELVDECQELDYKFMSASSVPVERATIKASEWEQTWAKVRKARALIGEA